MGSENRKGEMEGDDQAQRREDSILEISPEDELNKLELDVAQSARTAETSDEVTVIIKVAKAGYVPQDVKVRARISPNLFTASIQRADVDRLQKDPLVISMGTPKRLWSARS